MDGDVWFIGALISDEVIEGSHVAAVGATNHHDRRQPGGDQVIAMGFPLRRVGDHELSADTL